MPSFVVILAAAACVGVGVLMGWLAACDVVGGRRFRDGYLSGYNDGWSEKDGLEAALRARRAKELRSRRPRLYVVPSARSDADA